MNLLEDLRRIKQIMILESKKKWTIKGGKLNKTYKFKDFKEALDFVNKVAILSEEENHHPDLKFGWGYAEVNIFTHAINGLSLSDFILASKIDYLIE